MNSLDLKNLNSLPLDGNVSHPSAINNLNKPTSKKEKIDLPDSKSANTFSDLISSSAPEKSPLPEKTVVREKAAVPEIAQPLEQAMLSPVRVEITEEVASAIKKPTVEDPNLIVLSNLLNPAVDILNKNPVLAVISGKLEKVEPSAISSIVANNAFVKSAVKSTLASPDIEKILNQPVALETLFQNFEIDENLVKKAIAQGADLTAEVKPKDFLKALGVDPKRVGVEMALMSQSIAKEGLKPFIQRTEKLAAKAPKNLTEIPIEIATQPPEPVERSWVDEILRAEMPVAAASAGMPPPKSAEGRADNRIIKTEPKPIAIDTKPTQSVKPSAKASLVPDLKTNILTSKEDVFESLKIDPQSKNINQTAIAAPIANSFEENLLGIKFQNIQAEEIAPKIAFEAKPFRPEVKLEPRSDASEIKLDVTSVESDTVIPVAVNVKPENFLKDAKSDFSDSDDDKKPSDVLKPAQNGVRAFNADVNDVKNVNQSNPNATLNPSEIAKKVLNASQTLLKDGGGSMRIDIKDSSLGPLNLALRVTNGVLELKILTPDKTSSDALSSALPKLRESLTQQGLNLKTVEVGVGLQNQFSGSQSNHDRAYHESLREYVASFKNNENKVAIPRNIYDSRGMGRFNSAPMLKAKDQMIAVRI